MNLILVEVTKSFGEHHAPRGYNPNLENHQKILERLRTRVYEIRNADTGEVVREVNI